MHLPGLIQNILGVFLVGGVAFYCFFAILHPLLKQPQEIQKKFVQENNSLQNPIQQSDLEIKKLELKLKKVSSFNLYKEKNYISLANKETSRILYYIFEVAKKNQISILKVNISSLDNNTSSSSNSSPSSKPPPTPKPSPSPSSSLSPSPILSGMKLSGINVEMEVIGFYQQVQTLFSEIQKLSNMITINDFIITNSEFKKDLNRIKTKFHFTIYFISGE